ncbi:predicted protein [Nematostella vectensis]|uniref:CB1 cannabinoid receptor-interacting protein 1 n=1 Tax=Nematostella vectensis TaxID=45351 RepID=A7S7Z5_NEMVE|nr:predicted protein [Nematostella vectensis]|eukprot:XP_001632224.1 predicted protein [Nematostella vectensis]
MASARTEERAFKTSLSLTRSEDSSPVFFKVDGERFKETRTLKLQVDSKYKVVLEFRPPQTLAEAAISGGSLKAELKKIDENCSVYEGLFSTQGMPSSKSKDRAYIVLSLKFNTGHEMNVQVQSKLYSVKDNTHVTWGACLKSLDFECKMRDGQSFVSIQKTTFR